MEQSKIFNKNQINSIFYHEDLEFKGVKSLDVNTQDHRPDNGHTQCISLQAFPLTRSNLCECEWSPIIVCCKYEVDCPLWWPLSSSHCHCSHHKIGFLYICQEGIFMVQDLPLKELYRWSQHSMLHGTKRCITIFIVAHHWTPLQPTIF